MKKILIPILSVVFVLYSCAIFQSKEHRAQNKLSRAVQLDPSILESSRKDSVNIIDSVLFKDSVRIKDSINITTKDSTIIIPKSDLNGSIDNPCDSIKGLQKFDYNLGSGVHKLHIWSDGKRIRYSSTVDSLVSIIRSERTFQQQLRDSFALKEVEYREKISAAEKNVVTIIKYKPTVIQVILILLGGTIFGLILGKLLKFLGF